MRNRTLAEWIAVEPGPSTGDDEFDSLIDKKVGQVNALNARDRDPQIDGEWWSGMPCGQLSVVLAGLRFLAMLHQTHHWISRGDTYYGDHLLFERLYNETVDEIDSVAEKSIGLGGEQNVNLQTQIRQIARLVTIASDAQTIPNANDLARISLAAEKAFLTTLDTMLDSMKQTGCSTNGVDNLLQGIADVHETHVYLLKRRCQNNALGM